MANPFVHVELATTDIDNAKSFYGSLFDWQLKDEDMGGGMIYTMINVGEGTGGGMMKHPVAGAPSAWLPHVLVDDNRGGDREGEIAWHCAARQPGNAAKSKPIDLAPSFARRRSTQAEKLHWPLKQPNQLFNRAIALCRNAG
jgi:catechol 2,3-dioxygenase-like lactoylglutathione lyase family enzyme